MNISGLHCCEKVEDEDCKQECITAFKEHDSVNDIIDRVEKACGPVDLMVSDMDQPARQGCNNSMRGSRNFRQGGVWGGQLILQKSNG